MGCLLTTVVLERTFCRSGQNDIVTVLIGLGVVGSNYVGKGTYTLTAMVADVQARIHTLLPLSMEMARYSFLPCLCGILHFFVMFFSYPARIFAFYQ